MAPVARLSVFNKRRTREFFLPSWGAHLPGIPELRDYEQAFFPVPNNTPTGFDLEYTSLLVSDGLVLDTASYEFITRPGKPQFAEMVSTIKKLVDHGYLRFEDFGAHAVEIDAVVRAYVDDQLRHPDAWLKEAREEWRLFKPIIEEHIKRIGSRADPEKERVHYGILCFLQNSSDKLDLLEAHRLQLLLESRKTRLSSGETEVMREIIRPMLTQAVFNQVLSLKLQIPFIDWMDMAPFHRKISLPLYSQKQFQDLSKDHLDKCRELFAIALDGLKPNSVDEVLQFLRRNKAVRSLKAEIQRAIDNNVELDAKWADALRHDAAYAEITYRKREQRFKWIGRALFAVPVIGHVMVPAAEAVWKTLEGVTELLGEGLDKTAEAPLARFEWYYTIIELNKERTSS